MRRSSSIEFPYSRFNHLPRVSSGPAVLLVTDDPAAGFAASNSLRGAGYEVKPVRLGQRSAAALLRGQRLARDPVELVVLDASRRPSAMMALFEALRGADSVVPVLVIAGPDDAEVREEAARLGAEAVLDSPLDLSRLRAAAESVVPVLREFDREVETRGYSFH